MKILPINQQAYTPQITSRPANFCGKEKSSLDIFMAELKKKPRLTPAQQDEFIKKAQAGDNDAKNKVIDNNLGLVVFIAKKYQGRGVPFEDLIQEGSLGLKHTIEKFEPERGIKFSTYAVTWIKRYILDSINLDGRIIRIPTYKVREILNVDNAEKIFNTDDTKEVAKLTGFNEDKVQKLKQYQRAVISLDTPIPQSDNDETTLLDNIGDSRYPADKIDTTEAFLNEFTKILNRIEGYGQWDRNVKMFKLHHGLEGEDPKTFDELGSIFGVTRERVRQCVNKVTLAVKKDPEMRRLYESQV